MQQPEESDTREIRIGVVAPLTGSASTTGNDMWQAAVLAADEINSQGGVYVNGTYFSVKLFKGDTETSLEAAVQSVTRLITQDEVDVLVGGFSSGITYADQVVAAEYGVPFIITGASSPVVTRREDIDASYFFHHCSTTDDYAQDTLLFADDVIRPAINERFGFSEDRKLRLAVLYQDSKYGEGIYEGIETAILEHGLNVEVVAKEKFKMSETDYRTALTSIKASKPDVVYPAAFINEQTLIISQGRRDVGLNTIYLAVECNDDPDYYSGIGRLGEYSIIESRFSPYATPPEAIREAVLEYKSDFAEKWSASPSMMGASTYEGIYVAAEAVKDAGSTDREKIRDALEEVEMPQKIEAMKGGVISFSPDFREAAFELYMLQLIWDSSVSETRPVIVWPENAKEADFVLPDWYEPGST